MVRLLPSLLTVCLVLVGPDPAVGVFCGTVFPLRLQSTAVWLSMVDITDHLVDIMLCGYWATGSLQSARGIEK